MKHSFPIFVMGLLATTTILATRSDTKRAVSPPQKAPNSSFGEVSGRIFLITKSGDLKPARMARVYLFFEHGPGSAAVVAAGAGDSPGIIYLKKYLEASQAANESGDSKLCRSDLLNADKATKATLEWAQERKLMAYVAALDADEEGYFSVGRIRPGVYNLVARGNSGINDAYWLQEITVRPGQKTDVKVSSVEASCADVP